MSRNLKNMVHIGNKSRARTSQTPNINYERKKERKGGIEEEKPTPTQKNTFYQAFCFPAAVAAAACLLILSSAALANTSRILG